ncbi:glycosyltransferase [Hymenobacter sp. DH14]|uniref:Glycosyltransferase n=1 Tax=Hymenobacter cyanobacteriorum TaxID=2926463 RepID=A0A9X1VIM6_9BACT|nr:glycosyltransferase [Hymenobacter cyanobacteriorum]MCI1188898.1 glycosyltransferase [Hymenobacter cyanobacteriorum]
MGKPKVSVSMITYNHSAYIAQAIESVMMQQTNFAVELVIGEDCSTDNTRAIIEEYQERYPGKIRLVTTPNNVGPNPNFFRTYQACGGEYIALLEGDDYWTDPQKLARQVEFMEANSDFSFCFHNALVMYEDGSGRSPHLMTTDLKPEYTLADITRDWNIATGSIMFRNGLISELPTWVFDSVASDLPVFVILASQGRVGFLSECMGVYRINRGGVTRSGHAERFVLSLVRMHENVDRYLNYRYHHNLMKKLAEDYLLLTNIKLRDLDYKAARHYLLRSLWLQLTGQKKVPSISNLKLLAGTLAPGLVRRLGRGRAATA